MSKQKKYWKGLEELNNDPKFIQSSEKEFYEEIPVEKFFGNESLSNSSTSRRDFLKFLGFSVTAASLAACEAPVRKAIPYLIKPEEVTAGVANWYATTYADENDYCDVIVKTREGRPIKIEGNKLSTITKGAVNARVQASVLSLYDSARLKGPTKNKAASSWDVVDKEIADKLSSITASGGNIRILSSTIISPSTKQAIADFTAKYPSTKHISYDAVSSSALIKANENSFGKAVIPSYSFDKAEVIVSFGADFLINWLSPIEFTTQYIQNRKVSESNRKMSRHIQVETTLSVTGSNADERIAIKPSQQGAAITNLYNGIASLAGKSTVSSSKTNVDEKISAAAKELWNSKGKALVVSNSNDIHVQIIINEINTLLGSYGNTIDLETPLYLKQGVDSDVAALVEEMKAGKVSALLMYNTNPIYSLPSSFNFKEALAKVDLKISFADRMDETAELVNYVCPDHHYLESWNDANPKKGHYALSQPTIAPLFNTRQAPESLLKWAGVNENYHSYIQKYWEKNYFSRQTTYSLFETFWNNSLQNGVVTFSSEPAVAKAEDKKDVKASNKKKEVVAEPVKQVAAVISIADAASKISKSASTAGNFELVLYEKTGIGNGNQANNPWLQELPDPISKVCWDNYLTMSPKQMNELGFNTKQGQEELSDLVDITVNNVSLKVPVLAQPGQTYGTIGLALGYGRTAVGKAANNIGVNAFPLASYDNGSINYTVSNVKVSGSVGTYHLAATQTHHTMMGREIVKETTLQQYIKDPSSGNAPLLIPVKENGEHVGKPTTELSLWDDYKAAGHFWNMGIDLNSCIGCGACVVSCQAENNVPVVGKDEVRRGREMHWMRIDRYYSSDTKEGDYGKMEIPSESPEVVFQPLMCQHCNHAPCETVCPVAATSHSTDGLNQMTYNRCVGTRYCANNCPYKVRRFNWFDYANNTKFDFNMNDDLGKMVLNPDVVVRTRGVMEKCSLCVQRIQEGKLKAKTDGRKLGDGEIQTACSQSCPTKAITFGDVNDTESEVAKTKKEKRNYFLLEDVGTQPNVFYSTKVRNV